MILIAAGLSMDSFAVSVTSGMIIKKFKLHNVTKISVFFAFFQGLMPLIGWFAGIGVHKYIESFDHWLAFVLLLFLGCKMLFEGLKKEEEKKDFNPLDNLVLSGLSIATSIDALIIGINFALLGTEIIRPVVIIALTTFLFSFIGVWSGIKFGNRYNFRAEIIGGIVLIGIGLKILMEHTILK